MDPFKPNEERTPKLQFSLIHLGLLLLVIMLLSLGKNLMAG